MSEQVKRGLSYFSGSRNYPLCNNAVMVHVLFLTPLLFPSTATEVPRIARRVFVQVSKHSQTHVIIEINYTYPNLIKGTLELFEQ